jgi:alkylated DNA repair dioxygenase AlkB
MELCRAADTLLQQLIQRGVVDTPPSGYTPDTPQYNCCLVNWYQPEHSIGLHADDEKQMDNAYPIWSLSWGGPRRFLLRPKPATKDAVETCCKDMLLNSGDLIAMGGRCQQEFKHEVPKVRKKDGLVDHRISWTIRRMKPNKNKNKGTKRKGVLVV